MSFEFKFDWREWESFEEEWSNAVDYLSQDLPQVALDAGDAAVTAIQQNHPYQDRTYLLSAGTHCVPGRVSKWRAEAIVQFQAPYANIVEEGSVKAQPYPFIFIGREAAEHKLEERMNEALTKFCQTLSRKR